VNLRAYAVRQDHSGVEVLLLDLSYEGCGIETPIDFDEGETLELRVVKRGAIQARVRWCRNGRAGLVFEADAAEQAERSARRLERVSLTAEVSMRRIGKVNYRVHVFDVSRDGCKVELVDEPRIDEHVFIKFEGLEALQAQVCWIEGRHAGLRFANPIHPAVFDLMLQRILEEAE
jgi:hypothetical protein